MGVDEMTMAQRYRNTGDLYRVQQREQPRSGQVIQAPVQQQQQGNPFGNFYKMGKDFRTIYDNAMAKRSDGWYGNSYHPNDGTMSDKAYFEANPDKIGSGEFGLTPDRTVSFNGETIDPKLFANGQPTQSWGATSQSLTNSLNQGANAVQGANGVVNGANAITAGGGTLMPSIASGESLLGGAEGLGAAMAGENAITAGLGAEGLTGGLASAEALSTAGLGAEALGASGAAASAPLAVAAGPLALAGILGLGLLDW